MDYGKIEQPGLGEVSERAEVSLLENVLNRMVPFAGRPPQEREHGARNIARALSPAQRRELIVELLMEFCE